jgi:hypothetical protein
MLFQKCDCLQKLVSCRSVGWCLTSLSCLTWILILILVLVLILSHFLGALRLVLRLVLVVHRIGVCLAFLALCMAG